MTDGPPVEERADRVIALLEGDVRTELHVRNEMLNLGLSAASIESLMQGVTSGLLYAFAVDWSPDWSSEGRCITGKSPGSSSLDAATLGLVAVA